MQSFLNVGLGIFSLFSGFLTDNFGFFVLELFFVLLALCNKKKLFLHKNNALFFGIFCVFHDKNVYFFCQLVSGPGRKGRKKYCIQNTVFKIIF
jgi:hypothetical protein